MSRRFSTALALLLLPEATSVAQPSAARFDAPVVIASNQERIDEMLDLDADGDLEAFGFFWEDSDKDSVRVFGYRNDGAGTFTKLWSFVHPVNTTGSQREHSAVTDLNGDGRDDFVIGIGRWVYAFASNGLAPPMPYTTFSVVETDLYGLVAADFDGDGRGDIGTREPNNRFRIYLNQGSGLPMLVASELTATGGVNFTEAKLSLAEVNGDGSPDLVLAYTNGIHLVPVVNAILQPAVSYLTQVGDSMAAAGDVDGDGDEDIVAFGMLGQYRVLRRTGPATFTMEATKVGGPATNLGDVDLDGDLDGLCCGGSGGPSDPTNGVLSKFEISHNDGTGTFAPAFQIQGLGARHLAGALDVDADGDVDLVAGRAIYYADGLLTENPYAALSDQTELIDAAFWDIDHDGDPDAHPGTTSAWRNDGSGRYSMVPLDVPLLPPNEKYRGPGHPGDWDGDGDLDILVTHIADMAVTGVRRLVNNGGGGFSNGGLASAPGTFFHEPSPFELDKTEAGLPADVDNDGDLDLLHRTTYVGAKTKLFLNDGAGFFTPGAVFAGERVAFAEDLNQDGDVDLVHSYSGFRLGLGGGAFGASQPFGITTYPWDRVELADFDHDGDLDYCAIDRTNGAPTAGDPVMFTNDGFAGFTASTPLAYGEYFSNETRRVFAVDANADGLVDVVFQPSQQNPFGTAIQLRKPDNSGYEAPIYQMLVASGTADVDGDGDVDLVNEGVYRNCSYVRPDSGFRRQYGVASEGTGGMKPQLGATGPFRVGSPATFHLRGAYGPSYCIFVVGLAESNVASLPFPGMSSYCQPWFGSFVVPFGGQASAAGSGGFSLSVVIPPAALGTSFFHQAFVFDPGAPFQATATNGLEIAYGPAF